MKKMCVLAVAGVITVLLIACFAHDQLSGQAPGQKEAKQPKAKRAYGPEQATGEPDALEGGDQSTAWAPLFPDAGEEWLLLEYATAVIPARVKIYENFNPGAVYKVSIFDAGGKEIEAWKGKDPTPAKEAKGISAIEVKTKIKTQRVKIYLNTKPDPAVPRVFAPYNEIDAVGLVDASGKTQWASAASASSTNADAGVALPYGAHKLITQVNQRLKSLEEQVRELRGEKNPLRAQWEYKTYTANDQAFFGTKAEEFFNGLGKDGWEYVAPIFSRPTGTPGNPNANVTCVLFKRLKK